MDSENISPKIEKLNYDNYYAWKHKISLLLALKDLDEHLVTARPENHRTHSHRPNPRERSSCRLRRCYVADNPKYIRKAYVTE